MPLGGIKIYWDTSGSGLADSVNLVIKCIKLIKEVGTMLYTSKEIALEVHINRMFECLSPKYKDKIIMYG
jgi:hypothetical protein